MTTSTPMTPDQWVKQLKKFDARYRELPTFRNSASGRDDETGLPFGPVFGCGIHHTGSDGADSINRELIAKGRSDLPGPLAHTGLNDDGVLDLHTCGRANHFGGGDPDVLAAVKAGRYGDYPPLTDKHNGEAGAVDGNDSFYGLEVYYSGGHAMTVVQYKSAVGWAAAICDFHGWTAKHAIGHKEWSDWKWDPGNIDMKVFRNDVQRLLDAHAAAPVGSVPQTPVEGPVATTPNITKAIQTNIAYSKALEEVGAKSLQDDIEKFRAETKRQRRVLREHERK